MEDRAESVSIVRVTEDGSQALEDTVAVESPLTIMLNDQELVTLLCTPADRKYLAVGFLISEGFLSGKEDIKGATLNEGTGVVRVESVGGDEVAREALFNRLITSGCGRGASFYNAADVASQRVVSEMTVSAREMLALARQFQHRSETYRATGGVHSAALCSRDSLLVFSEDIGRHNAIDKVFGECALKSLPTDDRIIITSGRISSEILLKVARRNVPVIMSKSAPTNLGVRMARDLGITLAGFVRGRRVNVYTYPERVMQHAPE